MHYAPTVATCSPGESEIFIMEPYNSADRFFYVKFENLSPNNIYSLEITRVEDPGNLVNPVFDSIECSPGSHATVTPIVKTITIEGRELQDHLGFKVELNTHETSGSNPTAKIKYLITGNDMNGGLIKYDCSEPLEPQYTSSSISPH